MNQLLQFFCKAILPWKIKHGVINKSESLSSVASGRIYNNYNTETSHYRKH